jgi:hypothetical protein
MNEIRYSLCPNCDACPEVVIDNETVLIGEEGNQVRLSSDEWDELVTAVKEGRLERTSAYESATGGYCVCGCECCASAS